MGDRALVSGLFIALLLCGGCTKRGDHLLFIEQEVEESCGPVEPVPQEVADLFTGSCGGAGCHTDGGQSGSLKLDPDVAAGELVGVAASGKPGAVRVVAGDAANSYLVQKMTGEFVPLMPLGAKDPLPDAEIDTVRNWINGLEPCDEGGTTDADAGVADDTGAPDVIEPTDEGVPPIEVTVPKAVEDLFQSSCAGGFCHVGQTAGGMSLLPDDIVANTVNVKAGGSELMRIAPGDPESSWLYQKTRNLAADGIGNPMPQGTDGLPEADLKLVEDWINSIDENTGTPTDGDTDEPPPDECTPLRDKYTVDYAAIKNLIQVRCAPCHIDGSDGGLNMKGEDFIANTVNVKAGTDDKFFRINPGAPDKSYLVLKLKGEAAGDRMPQSGEFYTDEEMKSLEEWIEDCASPKAEQGASTENQ